MGVGGVWEEQVEREGMMRRGRGDRGLGAWKAKRIGGCGGCWRGESAVVCEKAGLVGA